ncbi:MAG: peptidoglycan D,D-transpeptidase FtsI family protein, partial [bacterium]
TNDITYVAHIDWTKISLEAQPAVAEQVSTLLGIKLRPQPQETIFVLSPEFAGNLTAQPKSGWVTKIPGFSIETQLSRDYPYGALAGNLIGYKAPWVNAGGAGLEWQFDKLLDGREHTNYYLRKSYGQPLESTDILPRDLDGADLTLTIDERIQYMMETEMATALDDTKAENAIGMVMDAKTGEMLAIASLPTYHPADYAAVPPEHRQSLPLLMNYEPGSTFKPIVISAAYEDGLVDESFTIHCTGQRFVAGRHIGEFDNHIHGTVSLKDIIIQSCNVGASEVGSLLSPVQWREWFFKYGFGQSALLESQRDSGVAHRPLEENGILQKQIGPVERANMGFGQGVSVTPIQMIRAYSAFANDGLMVNPCLVKELRASDGRLLFACRPETKRVISKKTAQFIRSAMEGAVNNPKGTSVAARINGYLFGGKTGTAQKVVDGVYRRDKVIVSFFEIAPLDDPQYIVAVVLNEPKTYKASGGSLAAPVVKRIVQKLLWYEEIPPSHADKKYLLANANENAGMAQATAAAQDSGGSHETQ